MNTFLKVRSGHPPIVTALSGSSLTARAKPTSPFDVHHQLVNGRDNI